MKMNTLFLSKRANQELLKSYFFYEDNQSNLGDRFWVAIEDKLEAIKKHPNRFPTKKYPYQEALVNKFPFLIIYRYNKAKNLVFVSSNFHTSRNPNKKYR